MFETRQYGILPDMPARTALFHLFLAAILMLNGIASATAAVKHAEGPSVPAETSQAVHAAPVAGDAHDGCDELDPGLVQSDDPVIGTIHGPGHAPSPDCCEPGTCQSSCANTLVPVLASVMPSGFATPGQACSPPSTARHVAPDLPHLMRPPIT